MRYFTLLDFQHWVLALFFGLLAVIFVYVAWGLPVTSDDDNEGDGERTSTVQSRKAARIPPILILVYLGAILWAVGYAIVEGIFGPGL